MFSNLVDTQYLDQLIIFDRNCMYFFQIFKKKIKKNAENNHVARLYHVNYVESIIQKNIILIQKYLFYETDKQLIKP